MEISSLIIRDKMRMSIELLDRILLDGLDKFDVNIKGICSMCGFKSCEVRGSNIDYCYEFMFKNNTRRK